MWPTTKHCMGDPCLLLCTYSSLRHLSFRIESLLDSNNPVSAKWQTPPSIIPFKIKPLSLSLAVVTVELTGVVIAKMENPHPLHLHLGCLTPDGERAPVLALSCVVRQSQPMAWRLCSVPSWFRPLIIQLAASRPPSLPARTRDRQHRPCTQLGRKGN